MSKSNAENYSTAEKRCLNINKFSREYRGETEESNLTESHIKILKKGLYFNSQRKRNENDMKEEIKLFFCRKNCDFMTIMSLASAGNKCDMG